VAPEVEAAAPVMAASAKAEEPAPAVPEIRVEAPVMKALPAKSDFSAPVSKPTPAAVVEERKPVVTFGNLQGAAAAPARAKEAPAPEKAKASEAELFETSSAKAQLAPAVSAPTFSAVGERTGEGGLSGKKFLAIAAIAVVAFGLGYFAWTKFGEKSAAPVSQNVVPSTQPAGSSVSTAQAATAPPAAVVNHTPAPTQSNAVVSATQASKQPAATSSAQVTHIAAGADDTKAEVITRTFAPAPIRVKTQSQLAKAQKQADESPLPIPDPLGVGSSKDTNLASLVSGPAKLPAGPLSTLRISQGVSQGLLIKKVQPEYPQNAKAMRLEGPVEMEAVIDKEGKITNLKLLKGQPVLARAAMNAVRQWRYKPYYLDGEPVEIQTQITIVFKMPN
jgi:TonB family protein